MRAAPALLLTVNRFGLWRAAVAALWAAAAATLAAWLGAAAWTIAFALAGAAASLALTRRAPQNLAWDGERWRLGAAGAPGDEATPGTLRAMIDLGSFLLLRFEAEDARSVRWLPIQRRGHETAWHGLRCALYSPPLVAASVAPDAPAPPPA